jgi:phosphohistidine phosphatase
MSIVLYLMRHGIAEDTAPSGRDADRALTDEGIRKTKRVALGLRETGVAPDAILTSPLRRAEQTARLVAEVVAPSLRIETYPALAGGARVEHVLRDLRPPRGAEQIMLVGHQPDMGYLASFLLTGSADLAPLPFRKASVAAIRVAAIPPRETGVLEWFLTPAQLRALADGRN